MGDLPPWTKINKGVRSSYISTDLAILEERIERYRAKLAEMEGEAE